MVRKNSCINYLKGISCILIVFLHAGFPGVFGYCVNIMAKIGVPIFFMTSGYFTYSNDVSKIGSIVKRRVLNITKILTVTVVIYFIHSMILSILSNGREGVIQWFSVFNVKNVCKLFALNMTSFIDGWGIMWFMLALIYCYIAYYCLKKFFKDSSIFDILIPVLLLIHVIARYALNSMNIVYGSVYFQNWLFDGLPFFLLGNYTKKIESRINHSAILTKVNLILLTFVGLIASIFEAFLFGNSSFYFGTILAVISLFIFAVRNPDCGKHSWITFIGDKLSMVVYLIHSVIFAWICQIYGNYTYNKLLSWIMPIILTVFSLIIAYIYHLLSKLTIKRTVK